MAVTATVICLLLVSVETWDQSYPVVTLVLKVLLNSPQNSAVNSASTETSMLNSSDIWEEYSVPIVFS